MNFLILGRSVGLKKKKRKSLGNRRPGTPPSLLWSLETTRHEPKINMAEKVVGGFCKTKTTWVKESTTEILMRHKNGLTTSLIFFSVLKMPKIWVGRMTLNGEKNEDCLSLAKIFMTPDRKVSKVKDGVLFNLEALGIRGFPSRE